MNGLMLAAAADRGLTGTCLLGELPYFAVEVPNPGAALSAVRVFSRMTGVSLDLASLEEQADAQDEYLRGLMERLSAESENGGGPGSIHGTEGEDEVAAADRAAEPATGVARPSAGREISPADRQRLEQLFDRAAGDRSKAFELKQELDRLGIFKQYENRFLDLFRDAG